MTNEDLHVAVVTLELRLSDLEKRVSERGRVLSVLAFAVVTPVIAYATKTLLAL